MLWRWPVRVGRLWFASQPPAAERCDAGTPAPRFSTFFLGGWPGGPVPLSLLGLKCQISNTSFSFLNCKGNLSFSTLCASVNSAVSDRSCRYRRVRMSWQQCKLHLTERDAGWELVRPPLALFTRPRAPLTGRLSVDSSYRCRQPMLVPVSAPPLEKPTEPGLGVL